MDNWRRLEGEWLTFGSSWHPFTLFSGRREMTMVYE